MNEAMTFGEVRDLVADDDNGKWDALTFPGHLRYEHGTVAWRDRRLLPTPWAEGQLCARLGIPHPYFRRCPMALRSVQFDHWIGEVDKERAGEPREWRLRCRGETLRGALSGRFVPFDNRALLEAAEELVAAGLTVETVSLTEESFHLRLLARERGRNVLPDDRLVAGVHVANSEVGSRAVTLDALVYRLVCGNGLVRLVKGRSLLRRRHVSAWGSPVPELASAVREAMALAARSIDRLEDATTVHVPDVPALVRRTVERAGLPERVAECAIAAVLAERSAMHETLFGVVNGLTNAAQALPPDRRYELEAAAGALLDGRPEGTVADRPRAMLAA